MCITYAMDNDDDKTRYLMERECVVRIANGSLTDTRLLITIDDSQNKIILDQQRSQIKFAYKIYAAIDASELVSFVLLLFSVSGFENVFVESL